VIVRLGQLGRLRRVFYGPGERLLDPVSGTLDMFDALRAGTDAGRAEDSLNRRWCAFMRAAGWNGAGKRDEITKEHPDLVDWEQLPEATREKDRDTVRQLPELLADAGFRIVRVRQVSDVIPGRSREGDGRPPVNF
jgi:hypothetical protein